MFPHPLLTYLLLDNFIYSFFNELTLRISIHFLTTHFEYELHYHFEHKKEKGKYLIFPHYLSLEVLQGKRF